MSEPANKLTDEDRKEVKRRLEQADSPEDVVEDDEMPSRATVYDIKKEMEREQAQQKEMESEVFRDRREADRDDVIAVLEQANVGIKQSGDPKADVERALNAIDFDAGWDDPHYVADTLVEEAGMTREWANRVVRKSYDMPDFPYIDQDEGNGSDRQRRRRGRRRSGGGGGSQQQRQGRQRSRGGDRGRDNDNADRENSQLRREMQQLQSTVSQLADAVTEAVQDDDDDDGQMVEIEQDGKSMTVPYHVAVSQGLLGNSGGDDKDFMDKLREAKNAGIIPDPSDYQDDDEDDMFDLIEKMDALGLLGDDDSNEEIEMMQEMVDEMSEQFAEAQANIGTQMSAAISAIAEDEDDDDDEQVTMEDMQDWWEEKQKEDELDSLKSELAEMREEIQNDRRGRRKQHADPQNDPEVVKKRIDTDHERDQLEMAKETVEKAPDRIAEGVQKGLIPLFDRMQSAGPQGNPLWSPPEAEQRGEPEYEPEQPQQQRQPTPAEQNTYPQANGRAQANDNQQAEQPQQPTQDESIVERGEEVRDKLNLNADSDNDEAEA